MNQRRASMIRGFTLFEVAVSLAIVSMAIVTVMLLFPVGIKTQTLARFQVLASAKALEMVDGNATFHTSNPAMDMEAPLPWDVHSSQGNLAPDLERRLSSYRFGVFPLPLDIAGRIDSDNDEIQKVLADGGYLYYSQPGATTGFKDATGPEMPPNEAQKLVFTVTGYAQSNTLTHFAPKAWPYYMPYPSPPAHGPHRTSVDGSNQSGFSFNSADPISSPGSKEGRLWEHTSDPDILPVWSSSITPFTYGYRPYVELPSAESAIRYCQAAVWYCKAKGLTPAFYDITTEATTFATGIDEWKQVQAARFLSHAVTCLTNWYPKATLDGAGVPLPGVDLGGGAAPDMTVTTDKIIALHGTCMNLIMAFAASRPYDWAVPRPLNRAIMMDHPLIEWDMFSGPLTGRLFGSSPAIPVQQWRPLPATPISNIGRSQSYQAQSIPVASADFPWTTTGTPSGFWGDPQRVTITAPFAPEERCRQIVFWAVDWQSYEDFESLPSAPVEAGRYPKAAPVKGKDFRWHQGKLDFMDWQQFGYRNPEKVIAYTSADVRTRPSGTPYASGEIGGSDSGSGVKDRGTALDKRHVFTGAWGADRNYNQKFDRGAVPKSVRLRAVSVARFNYYDLRVSAPMR